MKEVAVIAYCRTGIAKAQRGALNQTHGIPMTAHVLRNAVTQEYYHVEALKDAGGHALTTKYWFPDAAFDNGGVGLFSTLEIVETVEISLYLIGVRKDAGICR